MRRMPALSKPAAGVLVIAVFALALLTIYNKEEIGVRLRGLLTSTDTVKADFAQVPKLREFRAGSDVKIAGVVVGTVTDVESVVDGRSQVTMQLRGGTRDKLGPEPRATIRATLLLGGRYYVDLTPGGQGRFEDEAIPRERTALPIEVEGVLGSVGTPSAQRGIRASIAQLDSTLHSGGTEAIQGLVSRAPATLTPAGAVLDGLRGTRPAVDWTATVGGLRNTAAGLTTRAGQVESLIAAVDGGTGALAAGSRPLAQSISTMPETLRITRAGLQDLQPTLDQLVDTANDLGPTAASLRPMTEELDPVLERSRHLLADLRPLMDDAQPLVERLVPTAGKTTEVFDDLQGPVLDRVNGPIADAVMSPFKGEGPYTGNGNSGNRLFEELAFLGVRGAQDFGWHDQVGVVARVGPTAGGASYGGLLPSNEQRLEGLGLQQPPGPQASAGNGGRPDEHESARTSSPNALVPPVAGAGGGN